MNLDTLISIAGRGFATDKNTALKLYDLLSGNVMEFHPYNKLSIVPLTDSNLSISPLDKNFEADIQASVVLGENYNDYIRNKNSTH